ncbi:MAG: hypothetical protein HQK49_18195 [Oligoflexia bacterium]|nr:hypothetical protein [Oligoflexia bacterium]
MNFKIFSNFNIVVTIMSVCIYLATISTLFAAKESSNPNTENTPKKKTKSELYKEKMRSRLTNLMENLDNEDKLKQKKYNLHNSDLAHGTTSAILLIFTKFGNKSGTLYPTGTLYEQGKIPFSGELGDGITGIFKKEKCENQDSGKPLDEKKIKENDFKDIIEFSSKEKGVNLKYISTVNLRRKMDSSEALDDAIGYAQAKKFAWDPNKKGDDSKIQKMRLDNWKKLEDSEKEIILKPFPVVVGIKLREDHKKKKAEGSSIDGEILVENAVYPDEIEVLLVPTDKVQFVKKIIESAGFKNIKVEGSDLKFQ